MAEQSKSQFQKREHRILEVASNLFVRYGYNKTTVDEIADEAGVSKGTIYLHFKSKEILFEKLLLYTTKAYAEKWFELVQADPNGGTIAAMYKNSLYALSYNPFMSAIFKEDKRMLGSYLSKLKRQREHRSSRYEFVKMMQDAGAIRKELNPKVIAYIMNIMAYGLVRRDEFLPTDEALSIEDIIEGIAEIMDKALTPEDGGNPDVGKEILKKIYEAGEQEFRKKTS